MDSKKILLGLLIIIVVMIGFLIGRSMNTHTIVIEKKNPAPASETKPIETGTSSTSTVQTETTTSTVGLSSDQIKMLSALGIDTNKVTPAMITCAQTSLGASRVEEIKKGASLSFMEKAKLVACYK